MVDLSTLLVGSHHRRDPVRGDLGAGVIEPFPPALLFPEDQRNLERRATKETGGR